MDILDLNDDGPETNRGYKQILLEIDIFTIFGRTVPKKIKTLNL